ncbi:MAG TPA: hypothetical protein VMZ69_04455 [Saprospiraceae bacterium]|nr:hypothetical protein [Saprospiraceae bacterium]
MILANQLKEHLKSPKSTYAGSRDKDFNCDVVRVVGVCVTGHDTVKFFIAESTASKTLDNFKANKLINLSSTNVFTTESYQLKGRVLSIKAGTTEDQMLVNDCIQRFDEDVSTIGFRPGMITEKLPHNPVIAIEFVVDQIFDQTPKVGTGKSMETV